MSSRKCLETLLLDASNMMIKRPGVGVSHWHGIRICACLLGCSFKKLGIEIGGFSSEMKEPKLQKLGVFWANYGKKHPIWPKLDAFLSKMVYWWVDNCAKIWYRESWIFEVQQISTSTYNFGESTPCGLSSLSKHICHVQSGYLDIYRTFQLSFST